MESKGGTEIQVNFLNKYLDLSKYNNINLIVIFENIISFNIYLNYSFVNGK